MHSQNNNILNVFNYDNLSQCFNVCCLLILGRLACWVEFLFEFETRINAWAWFVFMTESEFAQSLEKYGNVWNFRMIWVALAANIPKREKRVFPSSMCYEAQYLLWVNKVVVTTVDTSLEPFIIVYELLHF